LGSQDITRKKAVAPKQGAIAAKAKEETALKQIVTKEQCEEIFRNKISEPVLEDLNRCLDLYEINTVQRVRHFLAQCGHESGGLQWFLEFASGEDYEGREDLGNTTTGDGRKFKGAGAIQVTGRFNYTLLRHSLNDSKILELGAKYVAEKYPFSSAGNWWKRNEMNKLCDDPEVTVKDVTLRVNGGLNGLNDRIEYYQRAQAIIKSV
jgi:predicted chitinase